MTTITVTELTTEDLPLGNFGGTAGTERRRIKIFLRAKIADAGTAETLDLATKIPGLERIDGVLMYTIDGVTNSPSGTSGTAASWTKDGTTISIYGPGTAKVEYLGSLRGD